MKRVESDATASSRGFFFVPRLQQDSEAQRRAVMTRTRAQKKTAAADHAAVALNNAGDDDLALVFRRVSAERLGSLACVDRRWRRLCDRAATYNLAEIQNVAYAAVVLVAGRRAVASF